LAASFEGEVPEIEIGPRKLKVGLDAAQAELQAELMKSHSARARGNARGCRGAVVLFCLAGVGLHQRRDRLRGRCLRM
jgi:hypothetical protein